MDTPQALPRTIDRSVPISRAGQPLARIVYPGRFAGYRTIAERLADAVRQRCGATLELIPDTDLLPQRDSRLADDDRRRPLILLGNLNTNRAVAPLYARYLCATDATYPGIGGYEVRTLVNPYGTRANGLLLGGSDLDGVSRAADRAIELLTNQGDDLTLPYTLNVSLTPDLARKLADWPLTRLDAALPETGAELLNGIGMYAILYAWTGDLRYAHFSHRCLMRMNDRYPRTYGDWHYGIEKIVRALPWLVSSGLLADDDLAQTEQRLLGTAIGSQHMWWRQRDRRPPLGHRHHGKGTFAFYLQARYLLDQAECNEPARRLCEQWVSECRAFLDTLAHARIDDQDDESTLNNLSSLVWYALGEERFELFESGNARLMAQRAIALHDNQGAGAGVEGYGEGLTGAMYLQQEAGALVAASALYYQDGQLKWVRRKLPNLETPLRWDGWSVSPLFMHKYDTGDELAPQPPDRLTGLRRLPISPYQMDIMRHPPIRIEPRGHFVDAPETWQMQGGVGPTRLAQDRAFEKLVLRGGFERHDPYLLLQGYHGGYRWQGSVHSLNAIVRFGQHGHIWLIQNTDRQSYWHKNGVLVSNGFNETLLSPVAEWLSVDDFPTVSLSATRVNEDHRASWTRHLFWSKRGDGWFAVLDAMQPRQAGPFSFTCTWRTPGYAEIRDGVWGRGEASPPDLGAARPDGDASPLRGNAPVWEARQGDHVFRLAWAGDVSAVSEAQGVQGASNPYTLRQTQSGEYAAGSWVTFHNLFYSRPASEDHILRIASPTPGQALILDGDAAQAWCAIDPSQNGLTFGGLHMRSAAAMIAPKHIALSGATSISLDAIDWRLTSDRPVGVELDLEQRYALVQPDTPDSAGAVIQVTHGSEQHTFTLTRDEPIHIDLPAEMCQHASRVVRNTLRSMARAETHRPESVAQPPVSAAGAEWTFDDWQPVRERLRDLWVTAQPEPLDGYADQLVDGVTPEFRALSAQWPDSPSYEIQIGLGGKEAREQMIDSVRLVSDSPVTPTLRVYRPLPAGVQVEVSSDGFAGDCRTCPAPGIDETYIHQRFMHFEDPMQALRIPVHQTANAIRIRVPRPAGGGPLVLHEVEVYGERLLSPRVTRLLAADLDADGHDEVIASSSAHEVVVLGADGRARWRWSAPSPITHLAAHDLDGNGRRQVCVATLARDVYVFDPDGCLRRVIALSAMRDRVKDVHLGAIQAVNSSAIWRRDESGRGCLVLGCYGLLVFVDAEGGLMGHSYLDGAWVVDLATLPGSGGEDDVWARSRWNHGINVYPGRPGTQSSGAALMLGGVAQPLFRDCSRVIPFTTGHPVAFDPVERAGQHYIVAANDTGFGVLSAARQNWEWKIEGGTLVTACRIIGLDGADPQVVIGGVDGFVAAFGLLDGRPRQRVLLGAPITGLAMGEAGRLLVATRDRLVTFDADWHEVASAALAVDALCALCGNSVIVAQPDGRLTKTAWPARP